MVAYTTGFMGTLPTPAAEWIGAHSRAKKAKSIFVPFAGSCKAIQMMAGPDVRIETCDTQIYPRAIIEGVFAAQEVETNVDKLRYTKGYMFEKRPVQYMDDLSAGFIDWVGKNGTLFDKACIASAFIRSTFMGRMGQWSTNPEGLWRKFEYARTNNSNWIKQPGTFVHHEGSAFDNLPKGHIDFMQLDPPKVVSGSDVYSDRFIDLNIALGGQITELPKWNWKQSMPAFRQLMELDVDYIAFVYVTGVKPTNEAVEEMFLDYGTVEDRLEVPHKGRTDIITLIKKG